MSAVDVEAGHSPHRVANGQSRLEVVSANGRRVIVDRDVDVEVLVRIVRGLEGLR